MIERPILFSAPMVRALLAGAKTQTRRIAKPVKHPDLGNVYDPGALVLEREPQHVIERASPYGQPGDRLWVRESFRFPESLDHLSPAAIGEKALSAGYRTAWCPTQFEADGTRRTDQDWSDFVTPPMPNEPGRLRASIHMPRWASRITLEITGIRVERLRDISELDAISEGAPGYEEGFDAPPPDDECEWSYVASFMRLWDQTNGAGSWEANPWVWCVSFRRIDAS